MGLLWLLIIGGGVAAVTRHIMRGRYYGPLDDLLWGILGAFFGDSLTGPLGLATSGFVASLLMSCAGAASLMLITGCIKEDSFPPSPARSTLLLTGPDENNTQQVPVVSGRNHSKPSTESSIVRSGSGVKKHDLRQALHVASDGRKEEA